MSQCVAVHRPWKEMRSCNAVPSYVTTKHILFSIAIKMYIVIKSLAAPPEQTNPCHPNPCGSNSQCHVTNSVAVCSCIPGYFGAPPVCRPECVQNSDCLSYLSCVNQKCVDPCPGFCAFNAICRVTNNAARCQCPPGHTGDPFARCQRIGRLLYIIL